MENRVAVAPRSGGGGGAGSRFMRLPPGFRFHPTDEELLEQYLKKKIHRCPLPAFLIPEVELSRYDPWDLPSCGSVNPSMKECYVFCRKGGLYKSSSRLTRAAGSGYWRAAGKERQVTSSRGSRVIGTRKTLVFYRGRLPQSQKTDWTMHEYRLAPMGNSVAQCSSTAAQAPGMQTDEWVLCRIFDKKATKDSDLDVAGLHEFKRARDQFARFLAHHRDAPPPQLRSLPADHDESSCVTDLSRSSSGEDDGSISSS